MPSPDTTLHTAEGEYALAHSSAAQQAETEIDLLQLLYRLLENLKYIALAAVLGALLAAAYTFWYVTPMYQATSKLYVMNSRDSALNLSDLQIGTYLAADYQEVFSTWEVHEMVIEELGLDYTYKEMSELLTISNPADTRMLYITAVSDNAAEAADIANAYARAAQKYIGQTMDTEEPNLFSIALTPTVPHSPNKTRDILLGFLLGGILACGVFTVQFVMDDRLRSPEDIERYVGIPTLALVPERGGKKQHAYARKKAAGGDI